MTMESEQLPVIDWQMSLKMAGNQSEFAEKILSLLIKELPSDLGKIKKSYQLADHQALKSSIHRLHGALCYTGLPRLKNVVAQLEKKLNQSMSENLTININELVIESERVIHTYTHFINERITTN